VFEDARRRAYEAHLHAWESYERVRAHEADAPVPAYWQGSSYRPWSSGAKRKPRRRVH